MRKRNLHPRSVFLLTGIALLLIGSGCATRGYKVAVAPPPPKPSVPPPPALQTLALQPVQIPSVLIGNPQPQFDLVQEIIEKAEASFEKGRADYRAGHLEMAKTEFNSAIDGILQGPIPMQEDRRLA